MGWRKATGGVAPSRPPQSPKELKLFLLPLFSLFNAAYRGLETSWQAKRRIQTDSHPHRMNAAACRGHVGRPVAPVRLLAGLGGATRGCHHPALATTFGASTARRQRLIRVQAIAQPFSPVPSSVVGTVDKELPVSSGWELAQGYYKARHKRTVEGRCSHFGSLHKQRVLSPS